MSDRDPERWLFGQPLDPDDHPRSVHLDRIIASKKRWQWLGRLAVGLPAGAAAFIVAWQIITFLVEKFGGTP